MTCHPQPWRSRVTLTAKHPTPRQVRWFFRPAPNQLTRIIFTGTIAKKWLTSWLVGGFKDFFIFTTWTDDLFLTRIFQMFFLCHQQKSSVFYLTLRWWFSWRRIMEPFISWVVFQHSLGPKVEGFFGNKAMAMIEKDLAIDIELWPVQVQDTKKMIYVYWTHIDIRAGLNTHSMCTIYNV